MATSFRSPRKIARRLKLTPLAVSALRSWPRFMFNYALGLVPRTPYRFRSGALLGLSRAVDHVPIIEIFLRKDYGDIPEDVTTIVDIGANIGAFSIFAARATRNVRVYAYEPMASFHRMLDENVRVNDAAGTIRTFNMAVGDSDRDRDLVVEGEGIFFPTMMAPEAGPTRTVRVACTTLGDIMQTNNLPGIDLLKMDCEGAEYEILRSISSADFERIREIRMEYHDLPGEGRNSESLVRLLSGQGYEIVLLKGTPGSEKIGNLWARRA